MNAFISHTRLSRTHSKRGAFSLLEVAFALVIFVIGAIALLRIFPGGLSVLEDTGNRRVAAQMSQDLVTSYTSGDLASTTPEAIYNTDTSQNWLDYPLSPIGLKRQSGTIPTGPDDLTSAKDALKHIRGERQGVFNNSVYTNYIPDTKARLYREGTVDGVTVDPSGQLDFRNARYLVSNRSNLDTNTTKLDFRQPYLDEVEGVPVSNGVITLTRPTTGTNPTTYTLTWPYRKVTTTDIISSVTGTITPTSTSDCTPSTIAPSTDLLSLVCTIQVPVADTQSDQYFTVSFTATRDSSLRRASFVCKVLGPQGAVAGVTPPTPSEVLPIRAPSQLRGSACTYYVSSTWNGQTDGAYDQPMVIPTRSPSADYQQGPAIPATNTAAVVPSKATSAYSALPVDPALLTPLRFRQYLGIGATNREGDPVAVPSDATILDVDGSQSATNLTQVSIDYDVKDWEYISEDVTQFGSPFPGDKQLINTTTPEGLTQYQFQYNTNPTQSPAPTPIPRRDLREIRTHIGNLRGPIQIKGIYGGTAAQPVNVTFNPRLPAQGVGGLTVDQQRAYTKQANSLAKQGRLYIPEAILSSGTGLALIHARVYYRSRDAWAQQVSVTAPHYLRAGLIPPAQQEPWREYFPANDGYVYFHGAEAGKMVECVYGSDVLSASSKTLEIRPDVLFVTAPPANVPASFMGTFNNPNNSSDPRNGKLYVARSRDTVSGTIFDIRRPVGTSGVAVRTLWLNNDRYSQEIAQ